MAQTLYNKSAIESILEKLGFSLDEKQPHLSEEGLINMRDKRVLLGRRNSDGKKVVIKASNSPLGQFEIKSEKLAQDMLSRAVFSQENIFFPTELYYGDKDGYLIRVTEFIDQEKVFGAYPLDEQFFMIMREFEAQESFYANTFEHISITKKAFPISRAADYINTFREFRIPEHKGEALELLLANKQNIETRSNYLTHTDFAPSNFRVSGKKIYMIDLSSMHFGNRYEGLARFLNYCGIHNPELLKLIIDYIKKNRGAEEYLSLRLMRIYKAGYLLNHYSNALSKTSGDLHALTQKRLNLWQYIFDCLLYDKEIDRAVISAYKTERDNLRSKEELERQKEFNLI